ncbi:MAG: hypothetical protein RLZZ127_1977 [Planctomycetota bacterium]|jgi:type II secretory pathway pseudopilin PulG
MSPRPPFHPLTRALVVLTIVLLLATLLFPLIGVMSRSRGKENVGINLKQISTLIFAYGEEHGRGPSRHPVGTRIPAELYREETVGAWEILAAWSRGDASARLFWPRRLNEDPPATAPRSDGSGWRAYPAVFAYDWSFRRRTGYWPPFASHTVRPLIAERDPERWDGAGILVAFEDTHYEFIRTVPGTAETPPVRDSDPPLPWSVPYEGDDLFTPAGDGPGMDVVGGGSATRCFLK